MGTKLDLIGNLAIIQGATYRLILEFEGNYSTAQFKSEIRDNSLETNGLLLASFTFTNIQYDSDLDKTTVTASISAEETSLIPSTKFTGIGTINIKNGWVWDLETLLNGFKNKPIEYSFVQVIPEVTD